MVKGSYSEVKRYDFTPRIKWLNNRREWICSDDGIYHLRGVGFGRTARESYDNWVIDKAKSVMCTKNTHGLTIVDDDSFSGRVRRFAVRVMRRLR